MYHKKLTMEDLSIILFLFGGGGVIQMYLFCGLEDVMLKLLLIVLLSNAQNIDRSCSHIRFINIQAL